MVYKSTDTPVLVTSLNGNLHVSSFPVANVFCSFDYSDERFSTDLTPRKATVKAVIQEELTKLADEENETEAEKAGKEASAPKGV